MSAYYYLLPVTGALANLALLALNFRRAHSLNRVLFVVYGAVAGVNLSLAFMLKSPDAEAGMFWLFILRHFLFFLPLCLLVLAAFLSGRKILNTFTALLFAYWLCFIVLADFTYLTDRGWFVREMHLHAWGYFPVLHPPGIALLSSGYLTCFAISIYWLARPIERIAGISLPVVLIFYLVWWPGIMLNGFPLAGFEIPPFGNGIDAIVSLAFSASLHRKRSGFFTPGPLWVLSEMLASAAFGLLCGFLVLVLLPGAILTGPVITGLVMAAGSLVFLNWLRREPVDQAKAKDLTSILKPYDLSRQETRICELIAEGYSKRDVLVFLNIADGTLRNHLMSIYDKTIHKTSNVPESSRDKLQRLTVFLHRLNQAGP
ncbi:MAG: hypothetical protein JNM27_14455 [Leptospirales bacterium]|nr:hypothetical protein [Leptospirales bacterium]